MATSVPGHPQGRIPGGLPSLRATPIGAPAADATPSSVLETFLKNIHAHYAKWAHQSPGPQDILDYHIGQLWKQGIDGRGTTVAVIEGWDDPDISTTVQHWDAHYGLPDPTIETVYPDGPLPATCPPAMVALGSYGSCQAWQGELELDVLTVHLIAPYARIIISATPADSEITDDQASNVAPPEMMKALEYLSQNELADVISISDGTGENSYPDGKPEIHANDPGELTAAAAGVPVAVGTGDCGVVQNRARATSQCQNTTRRPTSAAWDDSPWVTAVGGSVPALRHSDGQKLGPDPLWHEGIYAEGAGLSAVFGRPAYQHGVATITHSQMRSMPDITMDAQDGTSESTPMFAGILALATQLNHDHLLGPVNPTLYDVLGPRGAKAGIADVVHGNNSEGGVTGYHAKRGFDVASGWGTLDAGSFVPALVKALKHHGLGLSAERQASARLAALEKRVTTTRRRNGAIRMSSSGFLPHHPVVLSIDGNVVTTLTPDAAGVVRYTLKPDGLALSAGRHLVTFAGMLITTRTHIRT